MTRSILVLSFSATLLLGCAQGREGADAEPAPAVAAGPGLRLAATPPGQSPGLDKQVHQGPVLTRRVDWFDGESAMTSYLSEVLISETGADEGGRDLVLSEFPDASVFHDRGHQRLWKLPVWTTTDLALERLRARDPQRRFSHVFHRGNHAGTPFFVAPGGVFVTLGPELSEDESRAWLLGRGLVIEGRLPTPANAFHVRSGAGLEALALAEELRGQPGVRATAPNLWTPLALR